MSHLTNLAKRHRAVFTDKFMAWFPDNEHVYLLFEYLADKLWASGKQHYSSRTISEKMRFDYGIVSANDTFKINNIYTPDLGRLYVLKTSRTDDAVFLSETAAARLRRICLQEIRVHDCSCRNLEEEEMIFGWKNNPGELSVSPSLRISASNGR